MEPRLVLVVIVIVATLVDTASLKKKSYYEILEVHQNATTREIRKSYFALVKIYHPDKNENFGNKKVREQFDMISQAYEILSDEATRAEYDRQLEFGNKDYVPKEKAKTREESENEKKQKVDFENRKFKNSFQAYEEALKAEEDEIFREKVRNIALLTFMTLFVIFSGYVMTVLFKRTKYYQKMEKKKLEQEISKNIAESSKKRKEQIRKQEELSEIHQAKIKHMKLLNQLRKEEQLDDSRITNWEGDEEEVPQEAAQPEESNEVEKEEIQPASKFFCPACKKAFKSQNQWENHELSNKHKQAMRKFSKTSKKENKDNNKNTITNENLPTRTPSEDGVETNLEE